MKSERYLKTVSRTHAPVFISTQRERVLAEAVLEKMTSVGIVIVSTVIVDPRPN